MVLELEGAELTVKGGCLSPDKEQEVKGGMLPAKCVAKAVCQRKQRLFKEGGLCDKAFA